MSKKTDMFILKELKINKLECDRCHLTKGLKYFSNKYKEIKYLNTDRVEDRLCKRCQSHSWGQIKTRNKEQGDILISPERLKEIHLMYGNKTKTSIK